MTPDILTILLAVLAGLFIGYLISSFVQKAKANGLRLMYDQQSAELSQLKITYNQVAEEKSNVQALRMRAEALHQQSQERVAQIQHQYSEVTASLNKVNEEKATLYAQLKHTREKLDNQQNDILRLREQFRLEFSELAQKILDDNSKKFTESNEQKIQQILEPLKLNISEFKQKVEDTYDKESKERFSLGKEVQRLIEMSQLVSKEANNLTTALKGNNKVQGNWGEMILESLLENSGLTKGREYFIQEFIRDSAGNIIKDEEGRGLQPDVTIYYPDQRKIIIDSKVSLVAWEQCIGCDDKETQRQFMLEHIRSIKQHIEGLSRKNYPRYALALDYVLLFIPIEPAFLEAVKSDVRLWKYAYEKKILLVSPTNLFAVLKIVADLWKVEQQNRNAIAIAEKAGALYDKFYGFIENLESVGKKIEDATNCYTEAFKQLSTGRGNIISRIQELKKMGAEANKQLPDRLIADSVTDNNEEQS
jgi:DNA recombination protein RmuC